LAFDNPGFKFLSCIEQIQRRPELDLVFQSEVIDSNTSTVKERIEQACKIKGKVVIMFKESSKEKYSEFI
jgi:hypothetical protein